MIEGKMKKGDLFLIKLFGKNFIIKYTHPHPTKDKYNYFDIVIKNKKETLKLIGGGIISLKEYKKVIREIFKVSPKFNNIV
jgi:hypothetical protein